MAMLEPWNDFISVSRTHYHMLCSFVVLMSFEEPEPSSEVLKTGGGVKRIETVSVEIKGSYV